MRYICFLLVGLLAMVAADTVYATTEDNHVGTQAQAIEGADPNSCYGSCGGFTANCACDAFCVLYGDCCYDYYAVCTGAPPYIPTGRCDLGGGFDLCGGFATDCGCYFGCQYSGTCCPDFVAICE